MGNAYCDALGIPVPRLAHAARAADANVYSLLIVALLERGEPITLEEAATRFAEAGLAPTDRALASLKRCRPARAPIYRVGDRYALDPHDAETDLWAFRLGLRPPRATPLALVRPDPPPLPDPDTPLTAAELDEVWREGVPSAWSAQQTAVCVLDAHGGAMAGDDVLAFVRARSRWSLLSPDSAKYWRRGSAVHCREDGLWELDLAHDAVPRARQAARERVAMVRRWAAMRPDPAATEALRKRYEREREEHAEHLARMRRVIVHLFPPTHPEALVLVDVGRRDITTLMGEETARAGAILAAYDIIAGVNVRATLAVLDVAPGERRLGELGPPQKTIRINRRGRTLRITIELLVRGSCGISRPFGDAQTLAGYLHAGETTKLRRRIEADAKSLYALYQYGRLHGAVRLRWGFLDTMIPVPWVHRDEHGLRDLMRRALTRGTPLEVVSGSAPGWANPWSRARLAYVVADHTGWHLALVDQDGFPLDDADVQLARLAGAHHEAG